MDAKCIILRSVYRHYTEFESYCAMSGKWFIEYRGITLSFLDLQGSLKGISPRKQQAFELNVIRDMLQRDTADIMGIKTVTVGQYVEAACHQIGETYWSADDVLLDDFSDLIEAEMEYEREKRQKEKELEKWFENVEQTRARGKGKRVIAGLSAAS